MLRQILKSFQNFAGRYSSPTLKSASETLSQHVLLDGDKLKYKEILKNSVKELSREAVPYKKFASNQHLIDLAKKSKIELSDIGVKDLDALGQAYFMGSEGLEKDYMKAISIWTESSFKGSISAKYNLAVCVRDGLGTEKDLKRAFSLLLDLADTHHFNRAQYDVATLLLTGQGQGQRQGIEMDHKKAFTYYQAAARGGIPQALYSLGVMHLEGQGTVTDEKRAVAYFKASDETGDPLGTMALAGCLSLGRGIEKDTERAHQLYLQLAHKGHPLAAFNIGVSVLERGGKEAEEAVIWFEKAGEGGINEAYVNLGNMYRNGVGVKKDLNKAVEVFSKGSRKNEICKALLNETLKEIDINNSNFK